MGDILRDIFLGFIRAHLLHHAAKRPIFGTEMIEELRHHGYDLSPGTLYPTLHKLEKGGFLACEKRIVEGKLRKYYHATPEGLRLLEKVRAKVRELTREIISHRVPAAGPFAEPTRAKAAKAVSGRKKAASARTAPRKARMPRSRS